MHLKNARKIIIEENQDKEDENYDPYRESKFAKKR